MNWPKQGDTTKVGESGRDFASNHSAHGMADKYGAGMIELEMFDQALDIRSHRFKGLLLALKFGLTAP